MRRTATTLINLKLNHPTSFSNAHIGEGIFYSRPNSTGNEHYILKNKNSITAQYLSGEKEIKIPKKRLKPFGNNIHIINASENNLQKIKL